MNDVNRCTKIGECAKAIRRYHAMMQHEEEMMQMQYARLVSLMPEGSKKPTLEDILNMESDNK